MSRVHILTAVLIASVLVTTAGCGNRSSPTASVTLSFESPLEGAEVSQSSVSPLATPTPRHPTPTPVTLSDTSQGAITGSLVHAETGQSVGGMAIYLAQIVESQQPLEGAPPYQIVFTQKGSPSATVDPYGHFALVDLSPGTFALVLWTPHDSWVITDPSGTKELRVEVEAGQVNDLGQLEVNFP